MVIDPRACSDGDAVHAMTPDGPANLICKEGAPYPWTGARFDYDHDDLTDVIRLVPARKVTRQDLPDFTGMLMMLDDMLDGWPLSKSSTLVEDTLAHVIGHLNDRGGLPDDRVRIVTGGREPRFVTEAHARLEAERDGAAARAIAAEVRAEKAEKESGHARSLQQLAAEVRAEKAEQLIPAYAMLDIWGALELIAAAPDLAATIAWLYGREGNEHGVHEVDGSLVGTNVYENEGRVEMESTRCDRTLTPDEAVDLARALLAAAEEARRG